jgi:hypothetical protein
VTNLCGAGAIAERWEGDKGAASGIEVDSLERQVSLPDIQLFRNQLPL